MSSIRIAEGMGGAGPLGRSCLLCLLCLPLGLSGLAMPARAADPGAASAQPAATATPAVTPAATPAASSADAAGGPTQAAAPAAHAPDVAPAASSAPAESPAPAAASDSIQLGTTEISGNRELPKLLYIVPWQRAQIGKFPGRPPNSLVDEALTPVDRSVFERQNRYYAALASRTQSARSQGGSAPGPAAGTPPKDEK